MDKDEFIAYCVKMNVRAAISPRTAPLYKRAGVDYKVTIYYQGKDRGDVSASDGADGFDRAKDHVDLVTGYRKAPIGSQYEKELIARGESLFRSEN